MARAGLRTTRPASTGPEAGRPGGRAAIRAGGRAAIRAGGRAVTRAGGRAVTRAGGRAATRAGGRAAIRPGGRALIWSGAAFALALTAYLTDVATHPLRFTFRFFDLFIYNHAGELVRHAPATLYTWHFMIDVQYLYTPFAALGFAAGSLLPWPVLTWLMAAASFAAVPLTLWVTFGQLGWAPLRRWAGVLAVGAVSIWTVPVLISMQQGQIELVLMALIAWDLCQSDRRRWKGAGVGVAAGIKLVPMIFILYLVLAGKLRQAAVAAAALAGTVLIGFAALPQESASWWLTGYFLHTGDRTRLELGSLVNQSLLALVTRTPAGATSATALWLAAAAVAGGLGLAAAAVLHRSGRPTAGWVTCAVTGVLVSPISWDDHWVWVVPLLAVLVDTALRARGPARLGCWLLAAGLAAVFVAWPVQATGPRAFLPYGLVGFGSGSHPMTEIFRLHGLQLISWNLFVLAGLVMLAVLLAWAARTWRGRTRRGYRSGAGVAPCSSASNGSAKVSKTSVAGTG